MLGYSGLLNKIAVASTSDIPALSLDITFETQDIVRVKITDAINKRWEIPQSVIDREGNLGKARKQRSLEKTVGEQQYKITYTENPFSFEVIRASDGVSLFNLDPKSFIFQEQYITFTTSSDASAATYGMGESARLKQEIQVGSKHTLWAADIAALYNPSEPNLYGSFPYYVQLVEGSSHGRYTLTLALPPQLLLSLSPPLPLHLALPLSLLLPLTLSPPPLTPTPTPTPTRCDANEL